MASKLDREVRREMQRIRDTAVEYSARGVASEMHAAITSFVAGNMDRSTAQALIVKSEATLAATIASIPLKQADMYTQFANTAFSRKVTDNSRPRTNKDVKPSKLVTYTGREANKVARISRRETAKQNAKYARQHAEWVARQEAREANIAQKHASMSTEEMEYQHAKYLARRVKASTEGMKSISK